MPLPRLPTLSDVATNYDVAWEAICIRVERDKITWSPKAGEWVQTAAWWEETIADAWKRRAEGARKDSEERERARQAEQRKTAHGARDVDRASAYLATMGTGPGGAFAATLYAVRGFALGEREGAALVLEEYAPRYHRKLRPYEVAGMAKRAATRSHLPWGWLLDRGKTGGGK